VKRERLIVGVIAFLVFLIVPISGPGFGLAINNFGIVMGAGEPPRLMFCWRLGLQRNAVCAGAAQRVQLAAALRPGHAPAALLLLLLLPLPLLLSLPPLLPLPPLRSAHVSAQPSGPSQSTSPFRCLLPCRFGRVLPIACTCTAAVLQPAAPFW
jgi:hypothetical protein